MVRDKNTDFSQATEDSDVKLHVHMCMCVCGCVECGPCCPQVCVPKAGTCRGQKKALYPLELELQANVSHTMNAGNST